MHYTFMRIVCFSSIQWYFLYSFLFRHAACICLYIGLNAKSESVSNNTKAKTNHLVRNVVTFFPSSSSFSFSISNCSTVVINFASKWNCRRKSTCHFAALHSFSPSPPTRSLVHNKIDKIRKFVTKVRWKHNRTSPQSSFVYFISI